LFEDIMTAKSLLSLSKPARLMLAGLVLAAAGTVAGVSQAQPMGGPMMGAHMGGHMAGPMFGGGRMLERLLDGINATPEQRSRIQEIMRGAMTDQQQQRQARRALRDQAMALFTQPTVDARAAEALRQQMLQQHDQASRRWMQAMLDASAVLTPEQRATLAERVKQRRDMMERHQRERRAIEAPKS
jgi:periplasmic protein CpxP/Spy